MPDIGIDQEFKLKKTMVMTSVTKATTTPTNKEKRIVKIIFATSILCSLRRPLLPASFSFMINYFGLYLFLNNDSIIPITPHLIILSIKNKKEPIKALFFYIKLINKIRQHLPSEDRPLFQPPYQQLNPYQHVCY